MNFWRVTISKSVQINKRFSAADLRSEKATQGSLLDADHRRQILTSVNEYIGWDNEDLSRILFTDEFSLFSDEKRQRR